jgi:biotin carboxyl carrier protein
MKMEIEVKAPAAGKVTSVVASQGSSVDEGTTLLFIA